MLSSVDRGCSPYLATVHCSCLCCHCSASCFASLVPWRRDDAQLLHQTQHVDVGAGSGSCARSIKHSRARSVSNTPSGVLGLHFGAAVGSQDAHRGLLRRRARVARRSRASAPAHSTSSSTGSVPAGPATLARLHAPAAAASRRVQALAPVPASSGSSHTSQVQGTLFLALRL